MTESPADDHVPPRVTLLGTGTMGAAMARNIAAAGMPLTVWNRSREKAAPLADVGARVADSASDAVRGADLVVTMLFDADSVASVMHEVRGALSPDAVWLQMSTVGIDGAQQLQELADDLGVAYVDAPVLGTRQPAEQGTLSVLASGERDLEPRVAPVFDAVGSTTRWVGDAGAGSRAKLVLNAWVLTVTQGVAQSLALAEGLGLDPVIFLDLVAGGPLDAPYVGLKGKAMLSGALDPSFRLDGAAKDAELIVAATARAGTSAALISAIRDNLRTAVDAGLGDKDLAATYLIQRMPAAESLAS